MTISQAFQNQLTDDTLPVPKSRNLYLTTNITQESIADIIEDILEINQHDRYLENLYKFHGVTYSPPGIKLYIDSFGGSVYQCLGLIGVMDNSVTPIYTYVVGVAMSAGFIIAIHGRIRHAYKHATFMYHQLSAAACGKQAEMEESMEENTRLHNLLESLVVKHTNITPAQLKDNYEHKRDWIMDALEAQKLGIIDTIL